MQTEHRSEHLGNVEKVVTGPIVDSGSDHITVRDTVAGEDIPVRIDDTTRYTWLDKQNEGRLTDTGTIRVGFFIAGGVRKASEVLVLDAGNGAPLAERLVPRVH